MIRRRFPYPEISFLRDESGEIQLTQPQFGEEIYRGISDPTRSIFTPWGTEKRDRVREEEEKRNDETA
jgi:hypothetical protein